MFVLAELEDTVKIQPKDFGKSDSEAVMDVLNEKFANKVVQEVGLCICVQDLLEASRGMILYGDGCSYMKVRFRLVVFRPSVGEVLVGKIKSSSPQGVRVTLGFFDDIHIPSALLQSGSEFDTNEQVWVWNYDGEKMYMDIEEPVRFRIHEETFTDATPTPSHRQAQSSGRRQSIAETAASADLAANSTKIPPYSLTGSIQEDGLGLLSWWSG